MEMKKDTESILNELTDTYLSSSEKKQLASHTLNHKKYVCYSANLHAPFATLLVGNKKVSKGYNFSLSDYPFHRIVYTISGQAVIKNGKKRYIADSGSIYYFAPGETGKVVNTDELPWRHIYIHFTGSKASKLIDTIKILPKRIFHVSNPDKIQNIFENIVTSCEEQYENSQKISDCYLKILLLYLSNQALNKHMHTSVSYQGYIKCHNYINDNFSNILSLQDIADECYMDKVYICRLFKKYTKTSPMAYVTSLKMNKAALLLIHTDKSIKQISRMLNFENQYYFSRTFKKTYGISPKFYRDSHDH